MGRATRKATRTQTRAHNSRLVLRTIYEQGTISRAAIARETQLTRTTVSAVVADLMNQGLLEEVGLGPSIGGKPPILLSVVADSRHLIGIDLGGDAFQGAVVNLRGQIRHRSSIPLRNGAGQITLPQFYEFVRGLIAATDSPLLGIGIGSPGLMDAANGIVRCSVNLDWRDLPLRDLLEEQVHLPVYVANDSQVAALGEYTFGGNSGVENLVVIKVGRGIGAGIVLNGRLFHGETFGAGEIGHVVVVEDGEPCRCGHTGCLETVAGVRAIVAQAQALAARDPDSALHRFASSPQAITLDTVCRASAAGDEGVRRIVQQAGRYLGIVVANIVNLLSIRRIVIAGQGACLGRVLLDAIRQEIDRRSLSTLAEEVELALSNMDSDIVILGASALVLNRELGLSALSGAVA